MVILLPENHSKSLGCDSKSDAGIIRMTINAVYVCGGRACMTNSDSQTQRMKDIHCPVDQFVAI